MFDPMELDSGMQTLLQMQIEQHLADLQRAQRGLPTLEEQRVIQQLLAREEQQAAQSGRSPGRGRR
jgi:hypothetical protein